MDSSPELRVRLRQKAPIPLDAEIACAPGEVLALVGPSGSGKSTVLRAIAGIYRPREGLVECGGETWLDTEKTLDLPTHQRAVGLVFQSYALFPHMTAMGNVMASLGHLPKDQRAEAAHGWLARVHLAGLEARRPAELSGGQQQRVAVARALARNPKVLLLDEPFSAVDRSTRQRLYRELAELRGEVRVPIMLVTHDLDEAARLADRMTILRQGRTLQSGPPHDVMARPASVEVARLVDLRNIFTARVKAHRPETNATLIEWGPLTLEAAHRPDFAAGQSVAWSIPSARVVLHRRDRPSRGEAENPVPGAVAEYVRLGDAVSLGVRLTWESSLLLFLTVPLHVAQRNGLALGVSVTASLLSEAIHLMPPADDE